MLKNFVSPIYCRIFVGETNETLTKKNYTTMKRNRSYFRIKFVGRHTDTREYWDINDAVCNVCKWLDTYKDVTTAHVYDLANNDHVKIVRCKNGEYILL